MFEDDGTARTKLLSHLGFSPPPEEKVTTENDIAEQVDALGLKDSVAGGEVLSGSKGATPYTIDNGLDPLEFFNNLSPKADTPLSVSGNQFDTDDTAPVEEASGQEIEGQGDAADSSFDEAVQHALVVGDYKGAVSQCISAGRMADALVIAHVGGASLWESTRDQYLKTSRSSYLKVLIDSLSFLNPCLLLH